MRYALLVGTSHYDSENLSDLNAPRLDVKRLQEVLRTRGEFQVETVIDGTKAEIEAALDGLFDRKRSDDVVFMHFSGHGELDTKGRLHLLPRDADVDERGRLRTTSAVEAELLQRLSRDSHAGSKIFLLDCCYSGAYADGFSGRSGVAAPTDLFRQVESRGSVIIAAAGEADKAFEPPSEDGTPKLAIFTQAVVDALEGEAGDGDGDGWIDHKDLASYVDIVVPRSHRQQPTHFSVGVVGGIKLARAGARTDGRDQPRGSSPGEARSAADAPLDHDRWRQLLTYYRDCVEREARTTSMPEISSQGKQFALIRGKEQLMVGSVDALDPQGQAAVVARRAAAEGRGLRYGYPLVSLDVNAKTADRASWRVAPLLVVDVEAQPDGRLVRSGEVELNVDLMDHWIDWSPQERESLMDEFQADWAEGDHRGLAEKSREYLSFAGIPALQTIRPTALVDGLERSHPRAGAHNVAMLYTDEASSNTVASLLEDYEKELLESVSRFSQTSLAGLESAAQSSENVGAAADQLVTPSATNEAQQDIIRAAMSRRLTVATGPPGTGKSQLITGLVATATGAGESVLVSSTNNTAVNVVVDRSNRNAAGSVVRTGKKSYRNSLGERLGELVTAVKEFAPLNSSTRPIAQAWQQECTERVAELDARADSEHTLARSLLDRAHLLTFLGRTRIEEHHFLDLSDALLARWRRQAGRALHWGLFGMLDRWMLRRRLYIGTEQLPTWLDLLGAESEVRRCKRHLRGLPEEHDVLAALRAAQDSHREASGELLRATLRSAVEKDEDFILERATALSDQEPRAWTGFRRLLESVPAWATTALATRPSIVPTPALFDLVIIDEASQCSVAAVLPLLFRAKRALIIGDPHQLKHIVRLDSGHVHQAASDAGLTDEWLQTRQLNHDRYSAYHAAAAATGEVLWLDEHYRCHPEIVRTVNRQVYGNRLRVLTKPDNLTTGDAKPVRWEQLSGPCERTASKSWVNEDEATRVRAVVTEIVGSNGTGSIGVVSPYAAQYTRLRERLSDFPEVEVGTVHTFQGRECDVIVLSPTLSQGADPNSVKYLASNQNLWNVAFTRAISQLIVVGDANVWRGRGGLLGSLLDQTEESGDQERSESLMDGPLAKLHQRLVVAGAPVEVGGEIGGHRADLMIRSANGPVAVLLDRSGTGAESTGTLGRNLRQLCTAQDLMNEAGHGKVVRIPIWRCFDDLSAVVDELRAH